MTTIESLVPACIESAAMKFCPVCEGAMRCDATSGSVMFVCTVCGTKVAGTPSDARVAGKVKTAANIMVLYQSIIRNAPHDPTTLSVASPCPKCGLQYRAQLLLGSDMTPVLSCKCGYVVQGSE